MGKGEIARNEQFLLFPVFSTCLDNFLPFLSNLRLLSANPFSLDESKICHLIMGQPFLKQALFFMCLQKKSFENTVGKEEIACKLLLKTLWEKKKLLVKSNFSFFHTVFLPI